MIRRTFALSDHWLPRLLRNCRKQVLNFGLPPIPRVLTVPLLAVFLTLRSIYKLAVRVFLCEPFFKAYCTSYGRGVHTGAHLHFILGRGKLIVGDNVRIEGKCTFSFAARFSDEPTFIIGDNSGISHGCHFTIGKKIVIGRNCRIANNVWIFDSPGHTADPSKRMAGLPPGDDEVQPVIIEDSVWIGRGAIIMKGVTVGQGSTVVAGSVVMTNVPPNTMVAGNPARQFRKLIDPATAVDPTAKPV
ncbi:MAG: acyltransferase [Terriglobales bacterium]|jgi:acetyltransferase-like isoleucine patch superfamily enzyme